MGAVLAAPVLGVLACGPRVPPLEHTQPNPLELAQRVATAFERRDETELRALALSEQEFRDHVWPELPAARPERNLPFSYVWRDLKRKSDGHLARLMADRGGRRTRVREVRFVGGTTQYHSFIVHRDARVTLTHDDGTTATDVRLFGSAIEKDGALKVFSFVVD